MLKSQDSKGTVLAAILLICAPQSGLFFASTVAPSVRKGLSVKVRRFLFSILQGTSVVLLEGLFSRKEAPSLGGRLLLFRVAEMIADSFIPS